jgi:glycosyltransferase involved in cell wall biosynthesis
MRILLVSWYFPPANDVAALRVGKLADYLESSGHEVWVLTGAREHADESLAVALPPERILRVPWFDVQRLRFHGGHKTRDAAPAKAGGELKPAAARKRRFTDAINDTYMLLVQIPDRQIGWLPFLKRAGTRLLKERPFDLIYASGPPFTAFLAARALAKRFSIPWVAEYRDGWSRYVYTPKPEWRQAIDEAIETRVAPGAAAIVTVSEPWADFYRARFKHPTLAVYNGFDPENIPPAPKREARPEEPLAIVYLGALYQGLRDPSVLYQAIARSGLTPADIRVQYYGPSPRDVFPLAEKYGVAPLVKLMSRVPYARSLEIQREADVLLLLQSPHDPRNVPAKVFEYLASCRPILGLGLDDGIPARLIRERGAGFYVSDPDKVAAQLNRWVAEKKSTGMIADLPDKVHAGLSRAEQFARLTDFLHELAPASTASSS